jgi:hypothetical protein
MEIISVLAVLATIVVTILAYIFIIPEKKRAKLGKFFRFCHDWLNMKSLIIEKIVRFFYVFSTVSVVCIGFFMLFWVQETYDYDRYYGIIVRDEWMGWYGLLVLVVGPVAVRIVYELSMMFLLLVKNVIQINNKLKDQNEEVKAAPAAPAAPVAPVAPVAPAPAAPAAPVETAAPAAKFCTRCGAHLNENGTCPNCN